MTLLVWWWLRADDRWLIVNIIFVSVCLDTLAARRISSLCEWVVMVAALLVGAYISGPTVAVAGDGSNNPVASVDPLAMRFPAHQSSVGGRAREFFSLGFNDILVPGTLVAFARDYDTSAGGVGHGGTPPEYFLLTLGGYVAGLFVWFGTRAGHWGLPALLYLILGVLAPLLFTGMKHGELGLLWNGERREQGRRMM